jgi:hypothetical protein
MLQLILALAACSSEARVVCEGKDLYQVITRDRRSDDGCQSDLSIRNLKPEEAGLHRFSITFAERPSVLSTPSGWSCEVFGNDDARTFPLECVAREVNGRRPGAIRGKQELTGLSVLFKSGRSMSGFCSAVLFEDGAGMIGGVIGH